MSIFVAAKPSLVKAGPQGPGAGVLQTEFPLTRLLGQQSAQQKMALALKMGISVPWIRAAERTIGGEFQSVEWHLEGDDEKEIDAGPAYDIIAYPQRNLKIGTPWKRMTRADLWRITCRHMGLAGNAFWYLDELDGFGQPKSIIYIRPDRMYADEDEKGNLISWHIDKTNTNPGIEVSLDQVIQFMFEPPDHGHFGIGLVESALLKAELSGALDRHLASVLSSGGRLSGILAPKAGTIGPDILTTLERDWRSVVEQTDAAKRLQIVAAPVDFTPTVMTVQDIGIRDLMVGARDDLLGLWGVPVAMLGIHDRGSGLGTSTVTEQDYETLWKQGVESRLGGQDQGGFVESVQMNLLDFYKPQTELIIDAPTFDDEAPKYDAAQKSVTVPMRNAERREILGLEPFGDVRNPETGVLLDDEVWLPIQMAQAFLAPSDGAVPRTPPPPPAKVTAPDTAIAAAAGETAGVQKASVPPRHRLLHASLTKMRTAIDARDTPRLRESVSGFLDYQRADIARRLREHAAAIAKKPGDTSVWFPSAKYDAQLVMAMRPTLDNVATQVSGHIDGALATKKASTAVDKVLTRGAARVTGINSTTRDRIKVLIAAALQAGEDHHVDGAATILEVAASLESEAIFDPYRSELIARTEVMDAYNAAALASYSDNGITEVQAIDGDDDAVCAERDGQVYDMGTAETIEDHPNGTLDWMPVIPEYTKADTSYGGTPAVSALIEALKAREPVNVTVVNGEPRQVRTVIDRDPETGRVIGSHEEYVSGA